MPMQESGEMYLETILVLKNKNGCVRAVDVARELDYSKPSVSVAMKKLKEEGYIEIGEQSNILLSKKGLEKANEILHRHNVITEFLIKTLNVNRDVADKDACKIEHIISPKLFKAMQHFVGEKNGTEEIWDI